MSLVSEAYQTVLKESLPRLWRFGLVLSGDRATAKALAEAACERALDFPHGLAGEHADRWLMGLLASDWRHEERSGAVRRGAGRLDASETLSADLPPDPDHRDLARRILAAVGGLPEPQRSAVLLVYVEGYSYREAAAVLEAPVGTLISRLAAARTRLIEAVNSGAEAPDPAISKTETNDERMPAGPHERA